MAQRIEIFTKVNDTRSKVMKKRLTSLNYQIEAATVLEVYTINKDFSAGDIEKIAQMLSNPLSQSYHINQDNFDFALEIGFLPGVTDNIASTARETIEDFFKIKFSETESVHSSTLIFLKGQIDRETVEKIAEEMSNPLIQRHEIKDQKTYEHDHGMDTIVPLVKIKTQPKTEKVNLDISQEELIKLGKEGIPNEDGTRRGPLALDLDYLEAIKNYFDQEKRHPTDTELESIAQTWSEHCKHTIFAAEIDEIKDGLYKSYIKKATQIIREQKGDKDFCVSVFSDNSGGIIFDENWVITDKAETHNSPSALDPFGGAITGIVGVNRDCIGFGKGAKPIINKYGFCVGNPNDTETIYRNSGAKNPALSPQKILNGVVDGVNAGGNCSGIPTPQGFVYFHESYKGKPLVFVGTVGLIPKEINGQPSHKKSAKKADKIVVIGGRTGQDGIHGATFSSEEMTSDSPATAVQIGDPITQKKLSDAIVKEARDLDLYNSITDDGAGGLSCSVAEMAKECGGCEVELEKVPLKYPNLDPWKIWISESQERMTLAIPPEKIDQFIDLMNRRGVEATIIGTFSDSGRCRVKMNGETIMDLDLNFLHNGLPPKILKTVYQKPQNSEPDFPCPQDLTETLLKLLARPNNAGFKFISEQYDHIVQGSAVLGPLHGKGQVNSPASITRPLLDSDKGVICSQALFPRYSQIDTYDMAANSIDGAIRNAIAIGGTLDHLALMDNFCWCSSTDPQRLGELKAAAKACFDFAVEFGTPYISGKDSMFNDFKGFDKNSQPIKISALPTLLISSLSVISDISKSVSLDPKFAEDLIYILGDAKNELGGSEYFAMFNEIGNSAPKVNAQTAKKLYQKFSAAIEKRLISSALSPSYGGLGITLAKKAIAGQLGMQIDLGQLPAGFSRHDYVLFSESASRFVVTIDPKKQAEFESHFANCHFALIGKTTTDPKFEIRVLNGETIISTNIEELTKTYHSTFKDY